MRILLLSDTHGKLGVIERLAEATRAEAVIHAGDFGFYDQHSFERISVREVALQILHSDLPKAEIKAARDLKPEGLRAFAAAKLKLSDFPDYANGNKAFRVPVYAVWGNHEDHHLVEALRQGEIVVPNLHLLDERSTATFGPFQLLGLGGNVIPGPTLFDAPLAGHGGKIWSTLGQMVRLIDTAGSKKQGEARILVTHVSPGREPLVWWLAAHLGADYSISGHMGSPYCVVWNEFAVRDHTESLALLDKRREMIEEAWSAIGPEVLSGDHRDLVERGIALLQRCLEPTAMRMNPDGTSGAKKGRRARRGLPPFSFREAFAVNLPDADQGHAVLVLEDERIRLETHSRGVRSSLEAKRRTLRE